jgi:hypothetical protein
MINFGSLITAMVTPFKEDDIKILNKELFQFRSAVDFLVEHITNQQHQNINFDPLATVARVAYLSKTSMGMPG